MSDTGKYEAATIKFLTEKNHLDAWESGIMRSTAWQVDELDRRVRSDSRTLADRLNRFAEEETLSETAPTLSTLVNDININTGLLKAQRIALQSLIRSHFGGGPKGSPLFLLILAETV